MSIRDTANKMFNVNRDNLESRDNEILEEWFDKKEECDSKLRKIQKTKPLYKIFEEKEKLKNIDQKFYKNVEEFANNYCFKYDTTDRLKIIKIGRNIICNFIIERSRFLIDTNLIAIPDCKNEHDVNRWFQENCNNIGLDIPILHKRHNKFYRTGYGMFDGIDYKCRFICTYKSRIDSLCEDNYYIPNLDGYTDEKQRQIFYKFCEFVDIESLLIELEYLSSNFVQHKHPINVVDMAICYEKDIDLGIPILELKTPGHIHDGR